MLRALKQQYDQLGIEGPFSLSLSFHLGGTIDDPEWSGLETSDIIAALVEQQKAYQAQAAQAAKERLAAEAKQQGKELLQDLKEDPQQALKDRKEDAKEQLQEGKEKLKDAGSQLRGLFK